jgi:uncharacterized protein (DUF58 family)
MKALRWVYYTVMAACLIAGMYTGLRIYYIVFFTQLLVVTAMIIINLWTFHSFSYMQTLSDKVCVKGNDTLLHLEIVNERPIPLSLIEVHLSVVSLHEDINITFSLAPYSGQTFRIPVHTPYRGRYNVGMTKMKITDIFGLVTIPFDMRRLSYYRMTELIVLPNAKMPSSISGDIADTKLFSAAYLKHAEQGDSVSGARLYHEGDALRRINWKKSAQLGKLFVKQYEYPEREHIMLLVDTGLHGLSGEEALVYADTVCESAACIALYSLSKNRSVSMVNSTGYVSSMKCDTLSGFDALRRHLAILPFEEPSRLAATIQKFYTEAAKAQSLFIFTRELTPQLGEVISRSFASRTTTTVVLVGGRGGSGRIHTLSVNPGSDAAASLSGIL